MTRPLLQIEALDLEIGDAIVCKALQLEIGTGQSWAILGRNGVGKSTLLHCLAGLLPASGGTVCINGQPIDTMIPRQRAQRLAVLLQHSDPGFGASVRETVLGGRHPHRRHALAWESADDLAIVDRCLEDSELSGLAERALSTLSGGELRRVEIARLLAQDCPVSLLDEPLNHLDFAHQAKLLALLGRHCVGDRRSMLMVVHDLNVAYRHCDHWLLLGGQGEWHAGPRETLADSGRLSAAFGHPIERLDTSRGPVFLPCPESAPSADSRSPGTAC
jgi:iron complex transport system ATP-binding protein